MLKPTWNTRHIVDAINNVIENGYSVDHVHDNDKSVAIRAIGNGPGLWLHFKDGSTVSQGHIDMKKAVRIIATFLRGERITSQGHNDQFAKEWFAYHINQGWRDCEVVKTTPTRIRVEYEMPNAGIMGGWMYYADIGDDRYVSGY